MARPKGRVLTEVVKFRLSKPEFDEWCRDCLRARPRISFNQYVREMVRLARASGLGVGTKPQTPSTNWPDGLTSAQ